MLKYFHKTKQTTISKSGPTQVLTPLFPRSFTFSCSSFLKSPEITPVGDNLDDGRVFKPRGRNSNGACTWRLLRISTNAIWLANHQPTEGTLCTACSASKLSSNIRSSEKWAIGTQSGQITFAFNHSGKRKTAQTVDAWLRVAVKFREMVALYESECSILSVMWERKRSIVLMCEKRFA